MITIEDAITVSNVGRCELKLELPKPVFTDKLNIDKVKKLERFFRDYGIIKAIEED